MFFVFEPNLQQMATAITISRRSAVCQAGSTSLL